MWLNETQEDWKKARQQMKALLQETWEKDWQAHTAAVIAAQVCELSYQVYMMRRLLEDKLLPAAPA